MRVTLTAGSIKSHQEIKEISVLVPSAVGDYKVFIREYTDDDGDETETCVIAEHPNGERECIWSMMHPA